MHASVDADGLTVAVRDGGPGIPPADLPHVFERFYRGANVKDRRSGTGMGLAIAKGLLAVQHGHIAAENCPTAARASPSLSPRRCSEPAGADSAGR